MIRTWKFRFPNSKWQEIRLGAFRILVNLSLLMQGTSKPLPFNARNEIVNLFNAGLGLSWSDIPRNTRVPKGAVHKIVRHYSVHATTQPFSCFLVEVKILDNGWHPWSNWLALLPSVPCRQFLMLRVNFQRIDFINRKKIVIFQSIYKNTFIQLKKGMRTWRMQCSLNDRSCVKRVDCNSPNFDWLRKTNQIDSNYDLLLVKYTTSCRRCLSIVLIVSLSYFAGSVESLVGV